VSISPPPEAGWMGGVELHSISEDGTVRVKFRGACLVCPSINLTIKYGIERSLKDKLDWIRKVERVLD